MWMMYAWELVKDAPSSATDFDAFDAIEKEPVILLDPAGEAWFDQSYAEDLAQKKKSLSLSGHYEG